MGNILVLGANGFLGSCLVDELLKAHRVIGYDALASEAFSQDARYVHLVGDYCTETGFARILREHRITAVYHLISTTIPKEGTQHIEEEIVKNVLPTVRLLEAMAECGVKRLIFASSGGTVYGEGDEKRPHPETQALWPVCSYGIQKTTIESYLHLYRHMHGLSPIIARISNPYGPNAQKNRTQGIIPIFIRRLMNGEDIELYGDTVRDYLYIDDVIGALERMLDYQGDEFVFNIGSGEGLWLHELVGQIEQCIGIGYKGIFRRKIRSCDVEANVLDISRARSELGWAPRVPLQEGIHKTFSAMRSELKG